MSGISISAAVGANAKNRPEDVATVQALLNHFIWIGKFSGAKPLLIDGKCGPKTKQALSAFQFQHFLFAEEHFRGQIWPGGTTIEFIRKNCGALPPLKPALEPKPDEAELKSQQSSTSLLHIFDSSDLVVRHLAEARACKNELPVDDARMFVHQLDTLVRKGAFFRRLLFTTHGGPGRIRFGEAKLTADYWRATTDRGWSRLVTNNARIYFCGCNVAAEDAGWDFLEAASQVFMKPGGGEIWGPTTYSWGNPVNGHAIYPWGKTRKLFLAGDGTVIERFEQ
jgi:hypothetical protein